MCVCPLYEIRKLKKTQRSDQIKFSNSWTFIRQSNHLAAQRPFYLCSFAWCIMHTRWCQIRLLCGVFFCYFFTRCYNCKWKWTQSKDWGGGFQATDVSRSETVLLIIWRCAARAAQGRGNLRRSLRESSEDGGSTVQVRAARGIFSTSTRIFAVAV